MASSLLKNWRLFFNKEPVVGILTDLQVDLQFASVNQNESGLVKEGCPHSATEDAVVIGVELVIADSTWSRDFNIEIAIFIQKRTKVYKV